MRASTILGLTAATLASAAVEDISDSAKTECFQKADSGCTLALKLAEKCSPRDAKAADSVECACPGYFTATSECNTCLFEQVDKLVKENPELAEEMRSHVPYSMADSFKTTGDMIKAHEEKLCKQGKEPKLNFSEALDEVTDEFIEKYKHELDMTVTMSETASASTGSQEWATATAPDMSSVVQTTVTMSESGSSKATVSVPESAASPSATPSGDNNEKDGEEKEDGDKEDGEKEGEDKVPESGAASLVPAGIMVLAAGSALFALF